MAHMRAQKKSLNWDALNVVAKKAIRRRMEGLLPRSGVAEVYSLNKQFNRAVLSLLEACDSIVLGALKVDVWKSNHCFALDPKIFAAFCQHTVLVFPQVYLTQCGSRYIHKLSGIERLHMKDRLVDEMNEKEVLKLSKQLYRVLEDNKNSLKAVLGVPRELFEFLPSGLQLQEFSPSESTKSEDIKIPCLDTKLFKYKPHRSLFSKNWADTTPLPFMGINADEIQLEVGQLRNTPHDPSVTFAQNTRVKKLRIAFCESYGCDFARMFRQVAACCPSLEHFELLHERDVYHTSDTDGDNEDGDYDEYRDYVNELVPRYERVLREADVRYKIHLKAAVTYHEWEEYDYETSPPVATDFTCGLLQSDLPCTEERTIGKGFFCFVKQAIFGRSVLDVHCDVQHEDANRSHDDDGSSLNELISF